MDPVCDIPDKECRTCKHGRQLMLKGDSFANTVIKSVIKCAKKLDPYILKDSDVILFGKKSVFATASGVISCNGRLTGLKSLHRIGHNYYLDECRLFLSVAFEAKDLNIQYQMRVNVMNLGWIFAINAKLPVVRFAMHFQVNPYTPRETYLYRVLIPYIKGIKVRVSGLGPLNWVFNALFKAVVYSNHMYTATMVEAYVDEYLRQKLGGAMFPTR